MNYSNYLLKICLLQGFALALLSFPVMGGEPGPAIAQRTDLSIRNEMNLAIERGAAWLRKRQSDGGSWSIPEQPAITALALAALINQPSEKSGETAAATKKGCEFLLKNVQPDGGIYAKGLANYNTSLSLMALLQAKDPAYQPVIENARRFVLGQQAAGLPDQALNGGIGYGPSGTNRGHPDLSNTVMALEALYYSKRLATASEHPPEKELDWKAALAFIERCQNLPEYNRESWASDDPQNKGGFVYFPGNSMAGELTLPSGKKALRSYGSMSYAGLLSYIYADLKKDDPRVTAVIEWLKKNYTLDENPGMGADGLFYYYQVMAKALSTAGIGKFEVEGKEIDWKHDLALKLIGLQQGDGSWVNESGRWMEKDTVLVTAYAMIALEMIHHAM